MLSGFPDLHPRRMVDYPFGCGFLHWTEEMTREEFEAHKASQIAALLEWDRKRREVAK
jgi:hypothetical protein